MNNPDHTVRKFAASYGLRHEDNQIPLSFPLYFYTAYKRAHEIADGTPVALEFLSQDLGRLLKVLAYSSNEKGELRLDIATLDDVISGKRADQELDRLLALSADRRARIEATVELLGLDRDTDISASSVLQRLMEDKQMKRFHLEYLDAAVRGFSTNIFSGGEDQKDLETALLSALPRRLRAQARNGGEGPPMEDRNYPLTQAALVTYLVMKGEEYLCPPGGESVAKARFDVLSGYSDPKTIHLLRAIAAEIAHVILPDSGIEIEDYGALSTDILARWHIEPDMMGLAYQTKSGKGAAAKVDPYYDWASLSSHDDTIYGELPRQLVIFPVPSAHYLCDEMLSDRGSCKSRSQEIVIQREVKPLLRRLFESSNNAAFRAALKMGLGQSDYEVVIAWIEDDSDRALFPGGRMTLLGRIYAGFCSELHALSMELIRV